MPPIPFDTPLIPQFAHSFNRKHVVVAEQSALASKKLRENEVNEVLLGAYNRESINASPFIQDFFSYERRVGHGKTLEQIVDARCGQWLFMYAVLQTLPMTVVDARDLLYTEGVEYFLCIAPRGGRPWMKEDQSNSRAWYNVSSGGGMVSLPADLIDHSVEGIYRRSHCWTVANQWNGSAPEAPAVQRVESLQPRSQPAGLAPNHSPAQSPYASPHGSPMMNPITSHHSVPQGLSKQGSSVSLGLEALGGPPTQRSARPQSHYNPNITFDAILAGGGEAKGRGKKGKK
jgi:hypothetical protein